MKTVMKRFFVVVVLSIVGVLLASAALAAKPNNKACLGKDFSVYAQGGSAFGSFISTVIAVGGAGAEVQAHLAGDIPDWVIPNSCND